MMIRSCKTREQGLDPAGAACRLQYVTSGQVLPCTPPEGCFTAFAAPDWRGEIRVGRTSTLTHRSTVSFDCELPMFSLHPTP